MINLTTLKVKAIIGLGAVALVATAFFYVKHLNSTIDSLKEDKVELTSKVNQSNEIINENKRMDDTINTVGNLAEEQRVVIREVYDTKIKKVDQYVQEGKDRPVGPLLNSFFNDGMRNQD